jgi:hypothetical protein
VRFPLFEYIGIYIEGLDFLLRIGKSAFTGPSRVVFNSSRKE